MCGILGWVSPNGQVNPPILDRMRDLMAHRGPDGAGSWVDDNRRLGLAHRRLSIIDLSETANQPMFSSDGNEVIVFNGEIYNHRELREELEKAGNSFLTDHSDTEVLLVGYAHWGLDGLLDRVNGMFAFGLLDRRGERLFLVRDRIGIKPLYVARVHDDLLFASEIKAFFGDHRLKPQVDPANLRHHMAFRSLPPPRTLFRGIEKVPNGHYLAVDIRSARSQETCYWNPLNAGPEPGMTVEDAQSELSTLLHSSVGYRLEADVPVGLFLSGGLDSTVVLELAGQQKSGLSSYTAVYPGYQRYDETATAEQSARRHHARHHNVEISESAYLDALTRVAYHQDEPIAAPVCIPVFFLSERARDTGVPVILAGEGSDEIFVGYENWLRSRDLQYGIDRLRGALGSRFANGFAGFLARRLSSWSRVRELLQRAASGAPVFWGGAMEIPGAARQRLFQGTAVEGQEEDSFADIVEPIWQRFLSARSSDDVVGWMTFMDLSFRLPELMLPRLDKMGMAFSIEGRVPFLDHRIVELVFSLDMRLRGASGRTPKTLLRNTVKEWVPSEVVDASKLGFQAPVKEWKFSQEMQKYLGALTTFSRRTNLFNPSVMEELLARRDDRLYFGLLNFMFWYCLFIDNVVEDLIGDLKPAAGMDI